MKVSPLIILLRPHQYIKNGFIFLPIFFAGNIDDVQKIIKVLIAFISFSATASAIYIVNDIQDVAEDRQHPRKRFRPLAAGTVSRMSAIILSAVLLLAGFAIIMPLSIQALAILFLYVVINIFYGLCLKHIALIDVTTVAIGFVLRLYIGSISGNVELSMWIVILTFLLAQFLALAKRRDDMIIFNSTGQKMRKVMDGYNLKLIDSSMVIMASVVIVSYIMYVTSSEVVKNFQHNYLYLTVIFVVLGIMRYMQIAFVEENSGSPTQVIFKDIFMQVIITFWLLTFSIIIYF